MIGPPYSSCPSCGEPQLGTLSISNNHWTRRCRTCRHTGNTRLPSLQKRLIYLDQMVLSNIAKALDPVWRETRGDQDPFWLDLYERLERLVKLQVVVCVESPIHDQESSVTPYADTLRRLREYLSAKVEFQATHRSPSASASHCTRTLRGEHSCSSRHLPRERRARRRTWPTR